MNISRLVYKILVLVLISTLLLTSCTGSPQSTSESDISFYGDNAGEGTDEKINRNETDEGIDKWQSLLESGFFLSEACEVYRD